MGMFVFERFIIIQVHQSEVIMIKEKIQKEILKLSKEERAELVHLLIDSLDFEEQFDSEEAWAEELKRRIDQYESGEGSSTSWDEVKRNAKAMLGR